MVNENYLSRVVELTDFFGCLTLNLNTDLNSSSQQSEIRECLLPISKKVDSVIIVSPSIKFRKYLMAFGHKYNRSASNKLNIDIFKDHFVEIITGQGRGDIILSILESDLLSILDDVFSYTYDPYIYSNIRKYLKPKTKKLISDFKSSDHSTVYILLPDGDISCITVFAHPSLRNKLFRLIVNKSKKSDKFIQYSKINFEDIELSKKSLNSFDNIV